MLPGLRELRSYQFRSYTLQLLMKRKEVHLLIEPRFRVAQDCIDVSIAGIRI